MPWNIRRDFHVDINAEYGSFLIASGTDGSLRQPPPDMVAGDGMPVRFHFWERGPNGTLTAADPGADRVFIFSGRPAGAPAGSDLLFVTNDFAEISSGVWEGTLDLTTAEFFTHLADAVNGEKIILGELEVRDGAANTKRTSFQFDLTARRQVYNGEVPPLGLTTANWMFSTTVPSNGSVTIAGDLTSDGSEPVTFGELPYTADSGGKPSYSDGVGSCTWVEPEWILSIETPPAQWKSSEDVATPDLVTSWTPQTIPGVGTATGTPEITVAPPDPSPPFFHINDGFLYVRDAGFWKSTLLTL